MEINLELKTSGYHDHVVTIYLLLLNLLVQHQVIYLGTLITCSNSNILMQYNVHKIGIGI